MNALRRIVLALRIWAQEDEGSTGLSGAQVFVLEKIAEAPGQTLTEVSARTLTSKAAVSVVVSKLVDRGMVRRRPSTRDARSVSLDLTAAGRKVLEKAPSSPASRLLAALARLPDQERTALTRLLERLVGELGISSVEPRFMFDGDVTPHLSEPEAHTTGARRAPQR